MKNANLKNNFLLLSIFFSSNKVKDYNFYRRKKNIMQKSTFQVNGNRRLCDDDETGRQKKGKNNLKVYVM